MECEVDEISQKAEQKAKGLENRKDKKIRGSVHKD
jgi:hypothetical protein